MQRAPATILDFPSRYPLDDLYCKQRSCAVFANLKHHLRYWGFLLLKFVAAALGSGVALWFLNLFWAPQTPFFHPARREFGFDLLYTTLVGVWFQFSFG